MAFAQQMRIEFIYVVQLFTTNIALPWIALAVAPFVKEVERLVGKFNATK